MFKTNLFTSLFCLFAMSIYSQTPCDSPTCSPVPMTDVCADGTNTVTLTCDSGLTGIIWYNSNGTQVGTGCDLIINNSLIGTGLVGQSECFYYEADDSNSCPGESCCPVNVTVLNCMTCSVVGVDPTCNSLNDGTATVTPANGVAPFTYTWSNTQTTATATNLGAGTYTVTVSDAAGGTSTCSVTLTDPPALTCSVSTTNTSCFGISDGSAMVTASGGTGAYSYAWNNAITTASNPNLVSGTYTVTVTDAEGCTTVCQGTVADPAELTCSLVLADPSCNIVNGAADGTIDVTAAGGTGSYSYTWTTLDGNGLSGTASAQTGLSEGTYEVVITDENGCTAACSATLVEPNELTCNASATDESDCGAEDGSITVTSTGGTGAYSYELNGAAGQASGTFTGLSAGTYTIVTTDANGCTVECSATINAPSTPMCTISNAIDPSCNGGSDGSFVVAGTGGSGTYEFSLDGTTFQTSGTFSGLASGSYTVTVRNVGFASCTSTCNITLTDPPAMSCTVAGMDVSCNGGSDGSATVTEVGGMSPYTYAWGTTPTQTAATATMLLVGAYGVTVTDSNGCTAACMVTIAGPPALTCTLEGTDITCNSAADGSVIVTASGGTAVYEYSLNGGAFQASNEFSGLMAGSYVVTTRDANLCESSCTIELSQPDPLNCSNVATDATDCAIENGTITTNTVLGGTAPYTYTLNGGTAQTTNSFTDLGAGSYLVMVTDDNGCTTVCTAMINAPEAPMCSIMVPTDVSCNGGSDGSLTAVGSGGSGSFEYSLDATVFQSSGTFGSLTAGSYTVTVRNVGNPMCTSTCNILISEPAELVCTTNVSDTSCEGGNDGEAEVVPTDGTAPYTYAWDDAAAQTTATAINLVAGSYTVTVTDNNGCTSTCVAEVNSPLAISCSLTATDVSCEGAADGTITVAGTDGVMPYEYSLDGGAYQAGSLFADLAAGSYIVTIRDANMCISNCTIMVESPTPLSCTITPTDATDCSVDDGALVVSANGGTGSLQYSLNGGAYQPSGTFTGLAGGTYTITVQDENGCTTTCDGTINTPSAPTCTISPVVDVTCNGLSNGSLTAVGANGSGTYEYSIDGTTFQSSGTFTGLASGTYTITVINSGQSMCASTCTVEIVEPDALSCTTTKNNVSCNGASDGDATVVAAGGVAPYTYVWDDAASQTTVTASGLVVGTYTVTVTDANGCTTTCSAMIVNPSTVMCTLESMDVKCNGGMDGIVVVTGTGGILPYEYSLSGDAFQSGNVYNNLTAGTYTVNIKDANDCMSSCTIEVLEPTALSCAATATDATDCGVDDGTIVATGADGTPGYEYSLNGGAYQTAGSFTGLGAGTYTITVRDTNGCTSECSASVNTPSAPMCNIVSSVDVSCNGLSDGTFTVEGLGGSGAYEFSIDGTTFGTTATFADLAIGSYTVTVRNVGDPMCTSTCNVTIAEPTPLVCSTSSTDVSCNGDLDGTATITTIGGTMPYTYAWSNGQTSSTANSLAAGTYNVTVTDANGCTDWCGATVVEPMQIACSLVVVDEDCNSGMLGSITVTTTGGVMPFEYSIDGTTWQPGNAFNNLTAGTYTVFVRDMNLCMTDCTAEIMTIPCNNYDLALLKSIVTAGPYVPGQDVTYEVVVCNQGDLDANYFQVTDNIPAGMMLSAATGVNGGWMGPATGPVTYNYTNLLPAQDPDSCISVFITLTIDPSFAGGSLTNLAEITDDDGDDVDSDPTMDDGPDTDNDMNDGADDEDPETIMIDVPQMSIGSTVFSDDNNNGIQDPGEDALGSGSKAGKSVTLELYDANTGALVATTTTDANGSYLFDNLAPGDYYIEFMPPASLPVSSTPTNTADDQTDGDDNGSQIDTDGDGITDGVITSPVITLAPGTEPLNEPGSNGGKDTGNDSNGDMTVDFGLVPLSQNYDLALVKQVVTPGPYSAGQDVTYAIMVCNQGDVDANFFEITDHIPAGMMVSTTAGTNAGWVGGPTGSVTYAYNNLLAAADPDACATVMITLTIDPTFMGTSLVNNAELTDDDGDDIDSDPTVDDGPDTDDSMTDGADDEDPETITIGQTYDLALIKQVVTPGPYTSGQDVTYAIMVCNQGTLDANFFEITDHIPAGMMLSTTAGTNAGWVGGPTGSVTYAYNNLLSAADPDACATVMITLTIDPAFAGTSLVNNAELTDDDGDDVDSDPTMDDGPDTDDSLTDGADDEDPEEILLDTPLMSVGSTVFSDDNDNGIQDPGEDSIGSGSKVGKSVTLELYDANSGALVATTTTDANGSYLFDNLAPGDYYIEFMPPASLPVSSTSTNTADDQVDGDDNGTQVDNDGDGITDGLITSPVFTLAPGTEPVGEPGTNGGKDSANDANGDMTIDFGLVPVQIFDLALTKVLTTAGPFMPGDVVSFEITVINQGDIAATNTVVTDMSPAGLIYQSSTADVNVTDNGNETFTIASIPAMSSQVIEVFYQIDPASTATSMINDSEITSASGTDVDSTPGDDSTPDDLANDNNTTDTSGGDDQDPAEILIDQPAPAFDLALIKGLDPAQSSVVAPGDQVAFTITIVNQGMVAADNIEITDYIPTGFTFSAASNASWIDNFDGTASTTLSVANGDFGAGGLAPMAMTTVTLYLDVAHNAPQGVMLTNWAEISRATDDMGGAVTDTDSTPDNDQINDTFGGDDETNNSGGDEDDHDPASVTTSMYDLALVKSLGTGQSAVVAPGDMITYTITVTNQGDIAADNIEIADYIPACMTLADANWIGVNPAFRTLTVANGDIAAGGLAAGASVSVDITLMLATTATASCDLTNLSEIASSTDANGDPIPDGDSTSDIDPNNDGYGGTDITDNSGGDEDDHDDASVTFMAQCDLALIKETSNFVSNGNGTGGQVTYTITVTNQGGCEAYNVLVADYIPTGMTLNDANWTMTNGYASHTIAGPIAPLATASIDITLDVVTFDPMNPAINFSEIVSSENADGSTQMDTDSTPDDDSMNDGVVTDDEINNNNGDEDDHDQEGLEIMDLALNKSVVTAGPYAYGQSVEYSICVVNEGNMVAQNIQISDNVPSGMSFVPAANSGWTGTAPSLWYTFAGPLNPNQTACATLFLTLDPNPTSATAYLNVSEITSVEDGNGGNPSDWDSTVGNDDGDQSEDDEDSAIVDVYDLALTKAYTSFIDLSGNTILSQGDDVIYTITVYNQGTIDANNIQVTDYLPTGLTLSTADTNNWSGTGTTITNTVPFLAALSSTTIDVQLSIDPNFMGTSLMNWAEISSDDGDDGDSTPDNDPTNDVFVNDDDITGTGGDEDDSDPAEITLQQFFDLALTKDFVSSVDHDMSGTINGNDDVLYTITVYNQGTLDGTNIEVTDYIPNGMTLSVNDTNNWVGGPTGSVTNTIALVPAGGAPATIDILLTVDPSFMGTYLTNWAEISNDNNGSDVDSTPDGTQFNGTGETDDLNEDNIIDNMNGDEDDHDPAPIMVGQVFDLALMKMVDAGQPGPFNLYDDITYAITVYNQGTLDAYNINVIDYVQPGHIISPNDTNGWATDANGNYTNIIAGPLTPGTSSVVYITMRVTQDAYILQLDSLTNVAEITGSEDVNGNPQTDMDSTADSTIGNDLQMDDVTNGSGGDEDDEDPAFAMLEPLDPLGYIYCEKTGQVVTGGLVSITGPGTVTYGIDADGQLLDGRSGLYQYFVSDPGIYTMTWSHPSGIPLSTNCLPIAGTYDPTGLDGSASDRDGVVNNVLVLGSDTINDGLIDTTCLGNPYFLSVDIQPADPPLITLNNIPVSCSVIASFVCEDTDLDGIAETTDAGFDGITVSLYNCNDLTTPIATQVTANGGQYDFGGLSAGCYRLYFDLPAGFAVIGGGGVVNDNGWTNDIVVDWGECYTEANFCLSMAFAGLGDRVWHDQNGDGVQDNGEPGIADVKVELYSETGFLLDFTFTDSNGFYLFDNLRPGHYYVRFIDPEGYTLTQPNSGNNDNNDSDVDHSNGPGSTASTWLDPAELDLSIDAGYYYCVPVGDFVWLDLNNNSQQDNNENGINGVRVNLYRIINGVGYLVDYTYTGHKPGTASDDGYWKFCAPPGDYYVHFDVTSNLTAVSSGGGNNETNSDVSGAFGPNTTGSFTISSGDHRCDIDGGFSYSGAVTNGLAELSTGTKGESVISLSDLSGRNIGGVNELRWTAFNENTVEYYSINVLSPNGSYITVGKVLSSRSETGATDYNYEDYNYLIGTNNYRIKAHDSAGITIAELSSEIEVSDDKRVEVKLYPSITTSYANLKISSSYKSKILVDIVSMDGSTYMNSVVNTLADAGTNLYRLNTNGLTPGIYYVRVLVNDQLTTKKLIVVRE